MGKNLSAERQMQTRKELRAEFDDFGWYFVHIGDG